jgi:PD-(D/E)XK nuclease superfamily
VSIQVPQEWHPGFPVTNAGFLRISASQVGAEENRACSDFISLKSRPAAKIGEGYIQLRYPSFESFPLGIVRDALFSTINNDKVIHEFEDIEEISESAINEAIKNARNKVEKSHKLWAIDALSGYLMAWEKAREEDINQGIDFTDLEIIQAFDITESSHTEWFAWGIYLTSADSKIREFRALKFSKAGLTTINPVRAGVIARILAEGVPHSEPSWSSPRDPIYKILKSAEKVRIRELGCLDASQAIVLEETIIGAKKLFEEKSLPIVLQRVQGGTQKPGPSCRGCRANTMCPTLPNRPGLLGITAFAPWPKAYSPSKFHSYRRCPRQYFLQDELGLRTTQETQNNAQQRGLLVHAWLEQAHKRAQECSKDDIPTSSSLGIIATELGWNQEEANTALPFLIQHQLTCPINSDSKVVTELAIEALDTDADITVSTRPDLIYKNGDDLVWREIKTVSSIQDIEKDIYFNIYPQLPLAIRLMVEDCLPKEVTEKLGNFKNKRVELELISNDECKTISWDCDDSNVKLSAWSQLAEQVDSWASDTLFAPSPNPPCNWCKVSKWCEFANAEQVQADIGGLQVDLKTGEIIENSSIPLISNDDRVAKALGLSASLAEVSENDEDIPF